MPTPTFPKATTAAAAALLLLLTAAPTPAPTQADDPVNRTVAEPPVDPNPDRELNPPDVGVATPDVRAGVLPNALLHTPITGVFPGTVKPEPDVDIPDLDEPAAAYRGMSYFNQFNCIGCHAPNGAGGMGPSLSNSSFLYGGAPENIYLTILQGRPKGMPAFGGLLPDRIIWDLVAYVRSISREPSGQWGRTTSLKDFKIEQVPAQYMTTVDPWSHTQPFSYGQPPFQKVKKPEKRKQED